MAKRMFRMDVNPKTGKRLTGDEMANLAIKHGLITPEEVEKAAAVHHHPHEFESHMGEVTRNLRHQMWGRGELHLDTEPYKPPKTEPWMEEFTGHMQEMFYDRRAEKHGST